VIFHPGILALVIGSVLLTLLTAYGVLLGVRVFLRWDFRSSSAAQLALERKTSLISTITNYVLGFQIISALLFVYTVEDIHRLFVGAMCATGSLNANPVGWYALFSKIIVCFAAGLWIILNHLDQQAEDFPLVRLKYLLLALLLPAITLDSVLQLHYFLGLDPDIITSCCGSLFSESDVSVASSIAGLPVLPSMIVFYAGFTLLLLVSVSCLLSEHPLPRYLLAVLSAAFFFVALASVVSFISMYIYELPTHHCPFDMLQKGYGYIGYPLYISLFSGIFFGLLPGTFQPVKNIPSLRETILRLEKRWIFLSMGGLIIFVAITSHRIYFSNLTYFSY
jgi:hypothetical protein